MKTKVLTLTAKRINVRLKLSEAKDLVAYLADDPARSGTVEKLHDLLDNRINKEETI